MTLFDTPGHLDGLQELAHPIHQWPQLVFLVTQHIYFQNIPIVLDERAVRESMAWQSHSAPRMIQNCSMT